MKHWLILSAFFLSSCGMDPGKGIASRASEVSSYGDQEQPKTQDSGDSVRSRGTVVGNGHSEDGSDSSENLNHTIPTNKLPSSNQYAEILGQFDFYGFNSNGLLTAEGVIEVEWTAKTGFSCLLSQVSLQDASKTLVLAYSDEENFAGTYQGAPEGSAYRLSLVCKSSAKVALIFDLSLSY